MAHGTADGSIVIDTELDNAGFEKGADKLVSSVDGLTTRIEAFGSEMRRAFAGFTTLLQSMANATRGAGSSADTGAQQATQAANAAQQSAQAQAAAAQQSAKAQTKAAQQTAQAHSQTTSATQNATAATRNFDKELSKLEKKIATAKAALAGYYAELAQIEQSTDEALRLSATDEQAANVLEIEQIQIENTNRQYAKKLEILKQLEAEYNRVAAARDAANQSSSGEQAQQQAKGLSGALKALSQSMVANLTDGKLIEAAAKRVATVFGDVGRSVKKAAKNLLKMPFKLIATTSKMAVSGLKAFAKQAKKTGLSTNGLVKSLTSLKTMLTARIKRMFISTVFRDVGEGLQQLALFDSSFNTKMSNIKNRLTQLSGNISATVGNLLSALEPVITAVIDLMNKAVTAVNQFFAALSGKRTYTAAKRGNEQFAESAEEAATAQKKLNRELYSFDELNRQSKPDESATAAKEKSAIQFEELPLNLPAGVMKWVDDLKSAWKSADWDGVGEVLAEGLNATSKVVDDWINKLRPKGVEWANRAAEILNGLFDNVDWELLGKTVADGCNAIADIVNNFLTTFRAKDFGQGIGTTIKSWFDNVDWGLIGATFANKWNLLLHTVEGIVTTPGIWASIGQSIGQFVKSWFTNVDLNSIATSLIATFNGVTSLINAFLDQNPFEGVAEKIYTAVNRVLHEVNWVELGAAIGRLFLDVLKTLFTIVKEIDWVQLGVAVGQALSSINWGEVFANIGKLIWSALGAMFDFLKGMIKGDGLGILVAGFTVLAGSLAAKLAGAIFKAPLQQALTSVIADLLKGVIGGSGIGGWGAKILAAGKGVVTGLIGKIGGLAAKFLPAIGATLTKIVSGIVAAIGGWPVVIIAAAAAVIAALVIWIKNGGGEVIQGFIDGVKEKWEAVKQALKDFADLWITGFKNLFGIHSPSTVMAEIGTNVAAGLLQGISEKWADIKAFFSDAISNLTDFLSKGWKNMTSNTKKNWEKLRKIVTSEFDGTKNGVHDTAANMNSDLNETFNKVVSNARAAWSNMQSATLSRFADLHNNVINAWINLRTNLNSVQWNNVGHNLVAGLNNGVAGAWGGFMSNVSNMVNNLIRRIKNLFGIHSPSKVFAEIGEFLDLGLEQGMHDGERGLLSTAKEVATAVTEGMTPDTPNVQMNVDSVVGSMQAIISSLGSLAVTFQTIASALNSIGGFTLPNIAAGKVVPYQTKVAANAAPAGTEGGVEAHLLGILAELQTLSRFMRNGENNPEKNIRIFIGDREVFQAVVDEHNRTVRRTGTSPLKV